MQTLTQELIGHGLANRVLSENQLARLLEGSRQRRHHLVNRAMKSRELVRLKRGRYVLANAFRDYPPHPFALAQAFVAGSYVSFETALAHHGWIPEAVHTVASVTPGRKSAAAEHATFGSFSFHPLATQPGYFLELVSREQIQQQTLLIAEPIRALLDLVCARKLLWQGLEWLTEGLRIDLHYLRGIAHADLRILESVYKHKRVKSFLHSLARELGHD